MSGVNDAGKSGGSEPCEGSVLPENPRECALVKEGDWIASPNFNERRDGACADLLLLHYTATPTNDYALELLTSPAAGVSSHYLVDGEGRIIQMVSEAKRAWHAGEAEWAGNKDINSCSIGIEIQNQGYALARPPAYGRAQMAAVVRLCEDIVARHKIAPSRVLAHSDVAPHRKQDPGAHFNWRQLFEAGVGIWIEPPAIDPSPVEAGYEGAEMLEPAVASVAEIAAMQEKLAQIGYGIEINGELDQRTLVVVTAFQRHFRPALVSGVPDWQTLAVMDLLLERLELEKAVS